MKTPITFNVDPEVAAQVRGVRSVDWNAVVSLAIRSKVKLLGQTARTPVQVNRDPMPWVAVAERKRAERPVRPKSVPRPKPVAPTVEDIQRRRELLNSKRL